MNTNLTQKLSQPIVEKVAIVGAGPGGLAAAIALRSQGYTKKPKNFVRRELD